MSARRTDERALVLALAVVATLLAWLGFARFPPMAVRLGTGTTDVPTPAHYQASVVPAFVAFVAFLVADVLRRRERRSWTPRVALLLATVALALVRLHGDIPLSGHAVFLCAALAYELVVPVDGDAPLVVAATIPGLLVTGWYKLAVWGDVTWFVASVVAGGALGAALGRWARGQKP